jgi:hypothetical protein
MSKRGRGRERRGRKCKREEIEGR